MVTKSNSTYSRMFLQSSSNGPHISYIYSNDLNASQKIAEIIPFQYARIHKGGVVTWYIQTTTPTPDILGMGGKIGAYTFNPNDPHVVIADNAPLEVEIYVYPAEHPTYGIPSNQLHEIIKIIQKSKAQSRLEPRLNRQFVLTDNENITLNISTKNEYVDSVEYYKFRALKEFLYRREPQKPSEHYDYLDSGDEPHTHRALLVAHTDVGYYPVFNERKQPKRVKELIKLGVLPPIKSIEYFPMPWKAGDPTPKYYWKGHGNNEHCYFTVPSHLGSNKTDVDSKFQFHDVLSLNRDVPVIWDSKLFHYGRWVMAVDVCGLSGITKDGYAPDGILHMENKGLSVGVLYIGENRYALLDQIKRNGGNLDYLFSNTPTIRIDIAEKSETLGH